jgi:hypothetical protein
MSYNNLLNFYKTCRILKRDFNYSLDEQYTMTPFEREITITMINVEQKEIQQKSNKNETLFDPHNTAGRP